MAAVRSHKVLFAALLMGLLIWLPRGFALDRFVTADEHAWLARSGNFYRALSLGDFASTFQRHHPGVTTTWAGLAGFMAKYPAYAKDAPGYFGWLTEEIEPFLRGHGHNPVDLLAAGRTFVVLAITISLVVAFALSIPVSGLWPSLLGFALIAFSPFHIAHSRLLHLDGLVSTFMFLAVIAYLDYLRERRFITLCISAFAAGLAFLTRSPAFFLLPFISLLAIAYWAYYRKSNRQRVSFWRTIGAVMLWGIIAGLVFVLLWPSMWVDPIGSMQQVLGAATEYAEEGHLKPLFFNGGIFAGDPGWTFYPITYLWRTTPVVLLGLLISVVGAVLHAEPFDRRWIRFSTIGLMLYAVGYLCFMTLGAKKFDRYLLPIYPALALVAGTGYTCLGLWMSRLTRSSVERWVLPAILGIVLIGQSAFALPTYPYFLSYYNPLMGGSARAPSVMMIGWGEGADEAARYLNTEPDASSATVASGYTNGPFSYFYDGRTVPLYFRHMADYAVVYAQDWQRQLPSRRAIAYYARHEPMHIVKINGLDYAHIYDLRTMPMPDFVTDWSDSIRLASYQLPSAVVYPGETFRAIFYFVNLAPIDHNLNVLVRIVGPDGQEVARSEGWPWGAATSGWQKDEIWPDGHDLSIPGDIVPGWYRVDVGFYDPVAQELLGATQTTSGEPIGDLIPLDYIQVGELPSTANKPLSPPANLGGIMLLTGADWRDNSDAEMPIARARLQPGDTVSVDLFWESLQQTDVNYTTFLQIIGPDGTVAAQEDRQPLFGFMPTSTWLPDQVVSDSFTLQLPEDAGPGEYTIYTGMYDLETMERLPVTRGETPAGDAVSIASISVEAP
ncbi:MAG: ArnT family glycosyltransferase [Caldilineaceae bacterium]